MRAITVCVDYHDIARITIPWNRHHFDAIYVVTDSRSYNETSETIFNSLPEEQRAGVVVLKTDLFTERGATFAKWAALEWGLDQMGRDGWLCILDADVLWPRDIRVEPFGQSLRIQGKTEAKLLNCGELATPRRRMLTHPTDLAAVADKGPPPEAAWHAYPVHPQSHEFAGYTQIFHGSDPHLPPPPWHQTDWTHAGGADSFFQQLWPPQAKVRPPFEVLHLGPAGQNWYGRATPYLDGTVPPGAQDKLDRVAAIWQGRRGKVGDDRFKGERL